MTNKYSVSEDWVFFETVSRAAFANPFGETRDSLDRSIGGASPGSSSEEIIRAAIERVADRIKEMKSQGKANLNLYEGPRREVIRRVFLFHAFHHYVHQFDELIRTQEKKGASPCKVDFSGNLLSE